MSDKWNDWIVLTKIKPCSAQWSNWNVKKNNSNISTKVRNWQSLLNLVPALQLELGSSMHEDDTIANFNSFDILQAMIILFLTNELRSFDIYCYWYCCWPKFLLHSSGSIFRGEESVSIRVKKRDNCCCPQLTYLIYGLCTACVDTCRKSGKKIRDNKH